MAAYALGANDTRQAGGGVEADGLVASIHARDVAAPAPDALLAVDFRIDDGIAVEVGRQIELGQEFADQIGLFCKSVDIHVYDDSPEQYERYFEEYNHIDRYRPGECYGIPYRILVPKGFANLWVAGRCVSTDVKVHGSLRVQPAASMMGQAAGTAAAQASVTGETAFGLDTARLCDTLRANGATLE